MQRNHRFVFMAVCLLCIIMPMAAQEASKVALPERDPSTPQGMEGGFWRVDANFESVLQLKNVLVNHEITVKPVLYMADGTEYPLAPVSIEPAGVASVNIGTAIRDLPSTLMPHRSTYGFVGVTYKWSWPAAVMAMVRNIDEAEMVSFQSSLHSDMNEAHSVTAKMNPQRLEGVWWKPYATSKIFFVLSNTLLRPLEVLVSAYDGNGDVAGQKSIAIAPHSTQWLQLTDVLGNEPASHAVGSLQIHYTGPPNSLFVHAGIEDDSNGYSATLGIDEMHPELARDLSVHQVTLDAAGIMIGEQLSKMQFPAGTTFRPYVFFHNTSLQVRQVTISATAISPSGPKTIALGRVSLSPNETKEISVDEPLLKESWGATPSMNISFSYVGHDHDIVVETGSVDHSGNYVFQVRAKTEEWTMSRTICHWELHDETNTMFSLWNYTNESEDLKLTIYYTGGKYIIPIHLEPRMEYENDIATIIHGAQPDVAGERIPQSITEGSAILSDASDERNHISVASSAAVFSVRTATCGTVCETCNGVSSLLITPTGIVSVTLGKTLQSQTKLTYNTGAVYYQSTGNWSSGNAGIASVNTTGVVSGVSAGSTSMEVIIDGLASPAGYICVGENDGCPVYNGSASGSPYEVGPTPTSMVVGADQGNVQANACPVALENGEVREIIYQLKAGSINAGYYPIQESFGSLSSNTCGNGNATATACTAAIVDGGGEFADVLATGYCSPQLNNSCGFSITPDHWQTCTGTTLGSPTYVVDWNNITANGSTKLAAGTPIP